MQILQTFKNTDFGEIRTVTLESEPWFVGKDVAEALGYERADNAIRKHVDAEDKLMHQIGALGQNRQMYIINESGLYSLVLSSKLPTAKKFKRWITSEVIPSIRKHGGYLTPEMIEEALRDPDTIIQLATILKEEQKNNRRLEQENLRLSADNQAMKPKASYYDLVLNCPDLLSVTEIAKDFGKTATWLNKFLRDQKVQFKQGGIWLLYRDYAKKGYTSTKTHTVNGNDGTQHSKVHTYWAQKGRLFIYELLKKHGILPTVEQDAGNMDERQGV